MEAEQDSVIGDCMDHGQKGMRYGYGTSRFPASYGLGRKTSSYHRIVYMMGHGLLPEDIAGLDVMHRCNNARCINLAHLNLGTRSENQRFAQRTGRGYSFFRDGYRPQTSFTEYPA